MSTFRALLVLSAVLISSHSAEAQAVRFDYFASTTSAQCAPGKQCPLVVLPGTQVNICGGAVTNLAACLSAPATTYTNAGAGTPCANTSQLTPQIGGSCRATSDNQGNYGFWILPGTYSYFLRVPATAGGGTYGPYPISIGASAGCPLAYATCDANFQTLQAAIDASGSGVLYISKTWIPTSPITTNNPVSIICNSNGVIKAGASGFQVAMSSGSSMSGCTLSGNNAAHPAWVSTLISATGASGVTLADITITDAANSGGLATLNSPGILVDNMTCNAGLPCITIWASTASGDGVMVSGGNITMPVSSPGAGSSTVAVQTVGSSAGGHIDGVWVKGITVNNGGTNACVTVQGRADGPGPGIVSGIEVSGEVCNALTDQFGNVSLGGYTSQAHVHHNTYNLNGHGAFIQYEAACGDNQEIDHNTSTGSTDPQSMTNYGVFKDCGGVNFIADSNTVTSFFGVAAVSGAGNAGGNPDLSSAIIKGNVHIATGANGNGFSIGTSGANSNAYSSSIEGNISLAHSGAFQPLIIVSDGGSGTHSTHDVVVSDNIGIGYPYIFGTVVGSPTNVTLRGNNVPGATQECVTVTCPAAVSERQNIGFDWHLNERIYANTIPSGGVTACTYDTASGNTGSCLSLIGPGSTAASGSGAITVIGTPMAGNPFHLTVASGFFTTAGVPICRAGGLANSGSQPNNIQYLYDTVSNQTTLYFWSYVGLTAGVNRFWWGCTPN